MLSYLTCCTFLIIQECERVIQQLQNQISALQQDQAVAEAAIQRKDSLLMQAQQQWKTIEVDWNQRLALASEEKERLVAVIISTTFFFLDINLLYYLHSKWT